MCKNYTSRYKEAVARELTHANKSAQMIQGSRNFNYHKFNLKRQRREVGGGSGLGTRVHPWQIHVDIWQNQYSIVK